ncbi:MAG: hypothetical protein KF734_14310 [Saprospiraceae bacterium]|nr:hypothetical protein [Saprospiraceae bacterium]
MKKAILLFPPCPAWCAYHPVVTNLFKATQLLLALIVAFQLNAQTPSSIIVGSFVNGIPTLTKTDAELTSSLAFVLNNATLSNAAMSVGTDTLGSYYYILATATRPNQYNPSQMYIILSQNGEDIVFVATGDGSGCTMECIAGLPCTGCDTVVFETCKRMRCTCHSGSGGCNTSITFPN